MPEIGATLREARARQRVDIAEIEVDTKIRAKYLRALENEEWDLLPGTTYVKSFLRTYAEALGLDGRLLVEEYKLRHERLSDVELQPISPRSTQPARSRRSSRGAPRWLIVSVVLAGLIVGLYFLGSREDEPRSVAQPNEPPVRTTGAGEQGVAGGGSAASAPDDADHEPRRTRRPRTVRLQIVPLGPVFVCLTAAGRGTVLDGVELQPGDAMRTFRSRRFRLTLGNDRARLRINGRLRSVPPVTNGIGYEITRSGRRTLSASDRPTCT
jgi:cytoskeleton protein RodZ